MSPEPHRIRVPRTARYWTAGDPSSADEVWFVLHGYGQLAERFIRRFASLPGLDTRRRAIVAPEALSRFYIDDDGGEHGPGSRVGATWMTRADREHEIRDYVEYLDRLATAVLAPGSSPEAPAASSGAPAAAPIEGGARRLTVLGFSQGAATASRWATYGRVRPEELVLWGGGLAADLDMDQAAAALRDVDVRIVTGDRDRWAKERASDSARRMEAVGLDPELVEYRGGHEIQRAVLSAHWSL